MKLWETLIVIAILGTISLAGSVGFVLLCIWLGAKIVKAVL